MTVLNLLDRFGEETGGERGVGLDGDAKLSKGGEKQRFIGTHGGTVGRLVDGGENKVLGFGVVVVFENLVTSHVGEAELDKLS
jgi:hypothetical protein